MRDQAIEACRLLNDFVGDLIAGTRVPDALANMGFEDRVLRVCYRMCFSHLILTLAKFIELYERYQRTFPENARIECREVGCAHLL